jgi:hypothetical protein
MEKYLEPLIDGAPKVSMEVRLRSELLGGLLSKVRVTPGLVRRTATAKSRYWSQASSRFCVAAGWVEDLLATRAAEVTTGVGIHL